MLGGTGNDLLIGGPGNDTLDGGAGIDTMQGGAGDDTYYMDTLADVVTENANEGFDTIVAAFTMTLPTHVEGLTLTGTAPLDGSGNDGDNLLIGNDGANHLYGLAGNDTMNGGLGADTMVGGVGNDEYFVNEAGDVVSEKANEGIDTVNSSISYTLPANVENLNLIGDAPIDGTGNQFDNIITGNDAANRLYGREGNDTLIGKGGADLLDGGTGNDNMQGGTGDDTYIVDSPLDVVTENPNEGNDTVLSSIDYTLGANVENLTLTGTAVSGIGNELDNRLLGNDFDNFLSAGKGNDIVIAFAGNDTLQGGEGNDNLDGGTGNDNLDGGTGLDTMRGGLGDDTYTVDVVGELPIELANEGNDTVLSTVTFDLTAAPNLENVTLIGTAAINAIGTDGDNVLVGNTGDNTITAGKGNDRVEAGAGNDALYGGEGLDLLDGGVGKTSLMVGWVQIP